MQGIKKKRQITHEKQEKLFDWKKSSSVYMFIYNMYVQRLFFCVGFQKILYNKISYLFYNVSREEI